MLMRSIPVKKVVECIQELQVDLDELRRFRTRLSKKKKYTESIRHSIDEQINQLLNQIIHLQELRIEEIPNPLRQELQFAGQTSVTGLKILKARELKFENEWEQKVYEYICAMPKTEIHLHMEACISPEILLQILDKNQIVHDEEKIQELYQFSNLQEFIALFLFILDSIKTSDDFAIIYAGLIKYLEANHIVYAEVFIAPSRLLQNGLVFEEMIQVLEDLMRKTRLAGGPEVNLIIDVSRTFGPQNAAKILDYVLACKSNSILGIGLGGVELLGPARDFQDVFKRAKAEGLHRVAHAGEDDGPWSIRDSIELLDAERIGHATSLIQDPELMQVMRDRRIPIEVCLTSNIFTGKYVRHEADHPVRRYYDQGLICTVNTDDPEIFAVQLNEEYFKYFKYLNFTPAQLIDLDKQGVYATFSNNKDALWRKIEKKMRPLQELLMFQKES